MKLDEAVAKFIELRDERDALKKRQAAEVAVITEKMDRIQNAILKLFQKTGQKSAKTAAGTPYMQTRVSASVVDREAFLEFVRSNEAYDFLENRVNKTAVQQHMDDHEEPPPGVKVSTMQVINVTRSK